MLQTTIKIYTECFLFFCSASFQLTAVLGKGTFPWWERREWPDYSTTSLKFSKPHFSPMDLRGVTSSHPKKETIQKRLVRNKVLAILFERKRVLFPL
jgi:hypothetical protein